MSIRELPEHRREANLVGLPLKRSFLMRSQKLPIAQGRRWSAVPDDLDTSVLRDAMADVCTVMDLFDPQDAAFPVIDGHAVVEPGMGMTDPAHLALLEPEAIFPTQSNGQLQSIVRAQKAFVLSEMKKHGIQEHEIPTSQRERFHASARGDLLLPKWMLDPKKVDAIEKSIRMHAYEGLPELRRLHESELTIASTNTDVFMDTGWHPQYADRAPPRSVRESSELQKLLKDQKRAEETLAYVDPGRLVEQFLIPEAARDMQMWENPSLTLPWASAAGFFDVDRRRGVEPDEVDLIQEGVDSWLADGVPRTHFETEAGRRAFDELLWRMRHRDGMRPGILKEAPPYMHQLRNGGFPRPAHAARAPGFISDSELVVQT